MRQVLFLLGFLIFFYSCEEERKDSYDTVKIKQEILDKGASVVWGLNEANADTLVKDFWKSDSTMFLIDGMKIKGYEKISAGLSGMLTQRKKMDLEVDNEEVVIVSEDMAIHVVEFSQEVTQLNDSIISGQGIWSTFYKKMQGDWKIVMVHESHLMR